MGLMREVIFKSLNTEACNCREESMHRHAFKRVSGLGTIVFSSMLLAFPDFAQAYIGPGAGFAFLGSTFVFVLTIALAIITVLFWPFQWAWRKLRKRGVSRKAKARRIVIVGLDGLEPILAEKFMAEGKLPNLTALKDEGAYSRLQTTLPALSPVAWSSFQTGVNPGAHNIFDFLTRDKRLLLPQLASTEVKKEKAWFGLKNRSKIVITRKSQPFWKILGKHGIFSNILRVPISYPPEKFFGNILSAMCTPDLKGTQGSFTYVTTRKSEQSAVTGGTVRVVERASDGSITIPIDGPPKKSGTGFYQTMVKVTPYSDKPGARAFVGDKTYELRENEFSPWIELDFKVSRFSKVRGVFRISLREFGQELSIYISPVNVHPEFPALPISHPVFFSRWIAKKIGLFGTLGLMEDTWGRNEHALDDRGFLEQTYLTHREREQMFMDGLQKTREGLCVCVFDASDRIQHMFWRYLEEEHPSPIEDRAEFGDTIEKMYIEMDGLIGRVRAKLKKGDVLFVMSDHGFASFQRGINLNTWLYEHGYLVLKGEAPTGADYLQDVDWTKTRAFALGLSGMYINVKGREAHGIVPREQVDVLKRQIAAELEQIVDPQNGHEAISKVYDSATSYKGLYTSEAPDLIIGYHKGYRISWDSITGIIEPEVFMDNLKAWSGDHHVDPALVPGILFCNRRFERSNPHIVDLAPTALSLFGVKIPGYMEGEKLL